MEYNAHKLKVQNHVSILQLSILSIMFNQPKTPRFFMKYARSICSEQLPRGRLGTHLVYNTH